MAIYIDTPIWPAHGTVWSHLISDSSYEELHAFAARIPLPRRAFDLDHYDVPAARYDRLVALGALPTDSKEIVRRLAGSGLRVKGADREAIRPIRRREYLHHEWMRLTATLVDSKDEANRQEWMRLGEQLIGRWSETHREYHNQQHLEEVLLSLDQLEVAGEHIAAPTLLAAWYHDAVYLGTANDEADSARLAYQELTAIGFDAASSNLVAEAILATKPGRSAAVPPHTALLLDADLAILASNTQRYAEYAAAVRREYAHVADRDFRPARSAILQGFLNRESVFTTKTAIGVWELRARENLHHEISLLADS